MQYQNSSIIYYITFFNSLQNYYLLNEPYSDYPITANCSPNPLMLIFFSLFYLKHLKHSTTLYTLPMILFNIYFLSLEAVLELDSLWPPMLLHLSWYLCLGVVLTHFESLMAYMTNRISWKWYCLTRKIRS